MQISTFGVTACVLLGTTRYYWHIHVWDIPPFHVPASIKVLFTAKIACGFAVCTTRMSLICFYYRFLERAGIKHYKWILHFTMTFEVSVLIIYLIVCIFTCWCVHPL